MDRRDFVLKSLGLTGLLLLNSCATSRKLNLNSDTKFLIGSGKENQLAKVGYKISTPVKSRLVLSQINHDLIEITTPCKAHEIIVSPVDNNLVFAASKWGREAYIADIHKKVVTGEVRLKDGELFYGHSLFTPDGAFILATLTREDDRQGFVSIRDRVTLRELKKISTFGQNPHQISWIDPGNVVAIMNSNHAQFSDTDHALLTYVDIHSGKLLKKYSTSLPKYSHFKMDEGLTSAILCRSSSPGLERLYEKLDLSTGELCLSPKVSLPNGIPTESLSLIILEKQNIAIITIIGLKQIVVWNYKTNSQLFVQHTKDEPHGIGKDITEKFIYVTYAGEDSNYLEIYNLESFLKRKMDVQMSLTTGNGSHLTII